MITASQAKGENKLTIVQKNLRCLNDSRRSSTSRRDYSILDKLASEGLEPTISGSKMQKGKGLTDVHESVQLM
jgi:hypothetical protein